MAFVLDTKGIPNTEVKTIEFGEFFSIDKCHKWVINQHHGSYLSIVRFVFSFFKGSH